jgi:putative copper resistance protein D
VKANILDALPTAFDLLALVISLGALGCRLGILPAVEAVSGAVGMEAILRPLWRLLVICLTALTVSSLAELVGRAVEMSGLPLPDVLPLLPTILFHTHYGRVWLLRPLALTGLWARWCLGRRHRQSRLIPALMFAMGALVAMTRSASGHAADWGDPSFAELMDWLHIMASALWGGGLITLCAVMLPRVVKLPQRRRLTAEIARQFSILAGVALAGVLLTGLYNAWLQMGSISAIWQTPYGRTLLVKLLLVLPLLALGGLNHYSRVPRLQRWSERPVARRSRGLSLLLTRRLAAGQHRRQAVQLVRRFTRSVRAEAILIVGILMCTAVLLQGTPARHAAHSEHGRLAPTAPLAPAGEMMQPAVLLPRHSFDDAKFGRRVGGKNARQCEASAPEQGAILSLGAVVPPVED